MPKMDGNDVCRHIRADTSLPFMPIIMVTAKTSTQDVVTALEAGADEYLTKPVDHGALMARVKSMLRIKTLHDTVQTQSARLAEWNSLLEKRVDDQLHQLASLSATQEVLLASACGSDPGRRRFQTARHTQA